MKTVIAFTFVLVLAAKAVDWHKNRLIQSSHTNSNRIIGGNLAPSGFLQFQVLIGVARGLNNGICGGSLIKEEKVLTAAHCCNKVTFFIVFLATNNYGIEEPNRKNATATRYTMHESYNNETDENDICIIHLDEEVGGEGIATIRLPSRTQAEQLETFGGYSATVSGWGYTSNSDTSNTLLRYTDVIVMDTNECSNYIDIFTARLMLCANNPDGPGICDGDSGSPLTITESDGVKTQVGIVSFVPPETKGGCESSLPGGYVRLTAYLQWIKDWAGVDIRP
ncbi:Hypothetical predicted protein [Cloeon dipterum]|uniref:Peptidase S1 domain-containing protein n=1 Tax=Cloeon dipterum TaxID=197152 RepID=A0A8S1CWS1_9INSE|nr:Hypothetical predicted protein [Cloeon dipterum]